MGTQRIVKPRIRRNLIMGFRKTNAGQPDETGSHDESSDNLCDPLIPSDGILRAVSAFPV